METNTIPGARISRVIAGDGYTLFVTYDDETLRVDLARLVARGGVFAPLRDPARFAAVTVGAGGRWLEWPDGPDLCADALLLAARGEHDLAGD